MYNVFDIKEEPYEFKIFESDEFRECLIFILGYIKGTKGLFKLVVKDENGKKYLVRETDHRDIKNSSKKCNFES